MSEAHVKILKEAKAQIQFGIERYICCAVEATSDTLSPAHLQIIRYIESALGDYSFATYWLYRELFDKLDKKYKEDRSLWITDNREAIQEWRCRWIDQMIEIFKDVE